MRTKEITFGLNNEEIYDDLSLGPIGLHDAILLSAIARYVANARVLEFGCEEGFSTRMWLESGCAHLTCVDVSIREVIWKLFHQNPGRMSVVEQPQEEFTPPDGARYDIVFFDASHSFDLNLTTYKRVKSSLSLESLLIVHDTGVWCPSKMTNRHSDFAKDRNKPWADGGVVHQPEEQQFVRWLNATGWSCVSLGSRSELRHGLTVCQIGPQ